LSRRYLKQSAEAAAELGAIQIEVLSQIRTFKAMGLEHKVFADTREQTYEVMHAQLKAGAVSGVVSLGTGVIRAAGTAAFTLYAWTLILRGDISLGGFVAFSAYLGYLVGPVGQVAGLFADFQQMSVALGRAFEYLDLETEHEPVASYSRALRPAVPLRGEICLERVSFAYNADRPVLIDVSLACSPGTVTAIVGTSGAGKSSVLRLLCRMGTVSQGSIKIDGRPIEQIPHAELRTQLAVVWQEPALFRGTIWENLTIGLKDPTRAEVQDAVNACQLGDLIETLPSGYDTAIAEWGATLSGGQRQRFSIARALLRESPILLLDEATSQVDVGTEQEVLREIIPRARWKTVIFVTHRVTTAAIADQICVLESGRVAAVGTHDELAARDATYGRMLQASSAGEDLRRLRILGVQ
jgi:ABC-type bacteriocin/lantibiotic exporter with double-glycine peptidase domain